MNIQSEVKAYYAVIPASVRYDQNLSANAKLLYGEITALCNQKGYCWASNNYFLGLYKVSERSVTRWLNELKERGYIRLIFNSKSDQSMAVERCISLQNMVDNSVLEGRQNCQGVDKNVYEGRQNCLLGVDKNVYYNNTVNITRIDDEDELVKAVTKLFPNVVVDEDLSLTFDEYQGLAESYRRSTWLRQNFKLISKIHKHKEKILFGKYDDNASVDVTAKSNVISREYNADELNAIFDKLNENLV